MKQIKKILALLCAAVILISFFPVSAFAEEVQTGFIDGGWQVNPLYEDVLDPASWDMEVVPYPAAPLGDPEYITLTEAANLLRMGMTQRAATIQFYLEMPADADFSAFTSEIFENAVTHTGIPKEGDYLLYQYGLYYPRASYSISNGVAYYNMTIAMEYYTTAEQEAAVDAAVANVMAQLSLDEKNDYEKVCAIYDYICDNVVYDYDHLSDSTYKLQYTAYAALINGTSVCQGYANLFYRLALEAGLDARIISGTGNGGGHAWNIVKLGNQYYNVDATWDAGETNYSYFLRADANFYDHYRDADYAADAFYAQYPMAEADFTPGTHDYASIVTAPTCTEQGYTTYICTICGESREADYVDALGHDWQDASCLAAKTCAVCGVTEGTALGHEYGEWETTKEASCEAEGEQRRYCVRGCGEYESKTVDKLDHAEETIAGVAATCTESGLTEGKQCSVCGTVTVAQETVPASGHSYDNDEDADCNVCGEPRKSEETIETTPMYRLYNPNSGEHFYTGSIAEKDNLVTAGWIYEGIAWNAPVSSGEPVYRLYAPGSGDHHYTMSADERDMLVGVGWVYEGICWNSASADNLPLYRLYNPNATVGSHHYTGSEEERDTLVSYGWIYEGIGWFGMEK